VEGLEKVRLKRDDAKGLFLVLSFPKKQLDPQSHMQLYLEAVTLSRISPRTRIFR
jgi:hypothetical protein